MVRIRRAGDEDAGQLTRIQSRTFREDNARKPEGCSQEGPPGCDSVDWNARMIRDAFYYAIEHDGRMVGGVILLEMDAGHYELGRIYVEPEVQNRGIGRRAMLLVFADFPHATLWTLETPAWAVSNHRLYESIGFRKVRETPVDPDLGWAEFEYERLACNNGKSED